MQNGNYRKLVSIGSFLLGVSYTLTACAVPFANSYTDGGTWPSEGIFAQGFSPSVDPVPDPGLSPTDLVPLDRFTFFKAGFEDGSTDIQLAIIDDFFMDLTTLGLNSPELVGMSNTSYADTLSFATEDPIVFDFDNLELEYGSDYAAVFVNVEPDDSLTPVRVSALTADYVETEPGSGVWMPETNYGTEEDFQYSVSNFITVEDVAGITFEFFFAFDAGGDANFLAEYDVSDLPGDFDGNGVVNDDDLNKWETDFGVGPASDADGDGDSDGADFLVWQRNYDGTTSLLQGIAAVPEPGTLCLLGLSVVLAMGNRHRSLLKSHA